MTWRFASALDIGNRDEQQDRVAVLHSGDAHLLVVADGMGGHEAGALAAQTVVDIAAQRFSQHLREDPGAFLEKICLESHAEISRLADGAAAAPGSTCVMLYLTDSEAYWAHVGDSRMYQFSDNKLVFRTADHSLSQLAEEHGSEIAGGADGEIAQNQLYMCLGGRNEVMPEVSAATVREGDLFILCSDGLWNQVSEADMLGIMGDGIPDQQGAERLVALAARQGGNRSDNISLAVAYLDGKDRSGHGLLGRLLGGFFR